jgi:hypothetical protein
MLDTDFADLLQASTTLEPGDMLMISETFTPTQISTLNANPALVLIVCQPNQAPDKEGTFACLALKDDVELALETVNTIIKGIGGTNVVTTEVS